MRQEINCHIMRGGTSKGLFLLEDELPPSGPERDQLLLDLMGSPDTRQIDGLGGATSVTSKVAIIRRSQRPDADVDYTFAQVAINQALVDYCGNCGNISSGVGPFALETGLVEPQGSETVVRVYNTNTKKIIREVVQTPEGSVTYQGDYAISGVPGTAAPVKLVFSQPAGAVFGRLLPTGNVADTLNIPDLGPVEVSIVDAANPLVFVRASDIGLTGRELPADLLSRPEMLTRLEQVRGTAAVLLGLADSWEKAASQSPAVPKMTFIAAPEDYTDTRGNAIAGDQIDLLSRMMSMQKPHETYAMTGAICTVCAAAVPGTLVNQVLRSGTDFSRFRIGHPGGTIDVGVEFTLENGDVKILSAHGLRTARMLLRGTAYLKKEL